MGIGITANNVVNLQGSSWEDLFGIDVDDLTTFTRANLLVELLGNDQHTWVECIYLGAVLADADLTELIDLPKGSIIHCVGASSGDIGTTCLQYKTGLAGVDTWKYTAVAT